MDRLNRTLTGCGLALLLGVSATGCQHTRSSVPPGPGYTNDGRKGAPISFSSDPHAMQANANPALGVGPNGLGGLPTGPGGNPTQFGTPTPSMNNLGAPTGGGYGPPGASGLVDGPPVGALPGLNPAGAANPLAPATSPLGAPAGPGPIPGTP